MRCVPRHSVILPPVHPNRRHHHPRRSPNNRSACFVTCACFVTRACFLTCACFATGGVSHAPHSTRSKSHTLSQVLFRPMSHVLFRLRFCGVQRAPSSAVTVAYRKPFERELCALRRVSCHFGTEYVLRAAPSASLNGNAAHCFVCLERNAHQYSSVHQYRNVH